MAEEEPPGGNNNNSPDFYERRKRELELIRQIKDEEAKILESNRQRLSIQQKQVKLNENIIERIKDQFAEGKNYEDIVKQITDSEEKRAKLLEQTNGEVAKLILLYEEQNEELAIANQYADSYGQKMASVIETTLGISSGMGDILENSKNVEAAFEGMIRSTGETLLNIDNLAMNIANNFLVNTIVAVKELDAARASLNAATGAAGQLDDLILQTARNSKEFGVDIAQASAAITELASSMGDFNNILKSSDGEALVTATTRMQNLGISGAAVGSTYQTLTKGLNMTGQEAIAVQEKLATAGIELGIAPQKMVEGFNSALPTLAQFGNKAGKVFLKLSSQANKLGIEMNNLLGFVEQFDTFEGATKAAGQLNAMLGTQISSIELLTASYEERPKIILEAFEATGKSWEMMGRLEKRALAAAAGFQDIGDAAKFFEGGIAGLDEAEQQLDGITMSQEELAKAEKKAIDMGKKFKALMLEFTVAVEPALNLLHGLLDTVISLFVEFPNLSKVIGGFAVAVIAIKGTTGAIKGVAGGLKELVGIGGTFKEMIDDMKNFHSEVKSGWEETKDFFGGLKEGKDDVIEVKDELGNLSEKLNDFINNDSELELGNISDSMVPDLEEANSTIDQTTESIDNMSDATNNVTDATEGFADTQRMSTDATTQAGNANRGFLDKFKQFARTLTANATGLVAFGKAILAIGAGVGLAALGVAALALAFSQLDGDQIVGATVAIGLFMAAMVGMVALLIFGAPKIAVASAVLSALVAPILAVGVAVLAAGTGIAIFAAGIQILAGLPLSKVAEGITELLGAFSLMFAFGTVGPFALFGLGISLMSIAAALEVLSLAMDGLPEKKVVAVGQIMEAVTAPTAEASITKVGEVVQLARSYVEIQGEMKSMSDDAFVQAIKTALGNPDSSGTRASTGQEVDQVQKFVEAFKSMKIEMDGRKMGRFVQTTTTNMFKENKKRR